MIKKITQIFSKFNCLGIAGSVLVVLLTTPGSSAFGQALVSWDPTGLSSYGPSPWAATTTTANVTAGGLTRGAGVTTVNTAASSAWGGTNWLGGATQDITFTVTANTGYKISYSSLSLSYRRPTSGATAGTLEYTFGSGSTTYTSVGTFNFSSTSSSGATHTPISLSGVAGLQNVPAGTIVKFRIFPTGASANTGAWYVYNSGMSLNGTVSSNVTPTVAITGQDPNTPSATNWALGSTGNQFYWASLSPSGGNATLSSVTANMSGTYLSADIATNGLKLYYSSDATLVPAGDVLLGSQSSAKSGATENVTWSSLSQAVATGSTGYIYATADLLAGATVGRTLAGSFSSDANIVFTPTVSYGSNTYGVTTDKTFAALPTNPSVFSLSCASEAKLNVTMNTPTTGTVLVFANTTGTFTDPTGSGAGFTGSNANYASATNYPAVGGRLVYSGSGSNFTLSGLSAGQTYSLKAYSYSGSNWSSGTAVISGIATTQPVSGIVASPSSGQISLSWSNPATTACYNNVIVIARQGSAVEAAVSKANFDGLISDADLTGANANWALNGNSNDIYDLTATLVGTDNTNFLVYKGTGTSVNLTGLTNGTPYYFRVFTVDGTGTAAKWSAGVDANGTPSQPGYYWNGGSTSALPANGGTGTWGGSNAWRQPSASGSPANWTNNNAAVFGGVAGAVTVDADRTATSYLFNTNSYTLQTTSGTAMALTGPITLATNNELVLAPNPSGSANGILGIGSVNGTGTASIRIYGNQSSTNAARINIATTNATVNVPTNIVTSTGTGVAGYVSIVSGAVVSGNITNNSNFTTCLGATSGSDISLNGIVSGTSGLQFSAGASGGAGDVYLNSANTYSGGTFFNCSNTGVISLGINNALPVNGDVTMSSGSANGGVFNLNGYSQSVGNLTNNFTLGSIVNNGASSSSLTVNQTTAQSFGLAIKDGSGTVTLIKNGAAAWILTNNTHNFSGGLILNNGEVRFNPSGSMATSSVCPVSFNGGSLASTGIAAGRVVTFSTMRLSDNSAIALNPSTTHTLNFATSNAISWTSSKTLVITGWQGTYTTTAGSSGTAGKIFVGNNASALTNAQLSQIKFSDGVTSYDAILLANGELVPHQAGITTQLRTSYCGYTAQSFGEFIGADSVLTANHYRFQLVNTATSYTQTFTNSSGYPYLTLYTIPGISYNTTYTVTVAWSADGTTWSPYGSPCNLTSPSAELTQLEPGYCGYTASSYTEVIRANQVSGATQYEYKLVNTALGYSQSFAKTNNNFNLSQFSGLQNATTYSVSVRVFIFGAWDVYGPACQLTTPAGIPTTSLQAGSCGTTVSSYPQILFAENIGAATQYEYKVENTALGYSQTFVKTNNNFNLAQFSGLTNATTYSVSVRVNVSNTWGSFGTVCSVTTPAGVPTTSLQAGSCGTTVSSYPQILFAESVGAATQYEYKLENTALGYSQTFVKTNNNFNLAQFTGLLNNTTYSVSVRANVYGTWGSFGNVCQVTTPSGVPTTSLQSSYCGFTPTAYDQIIFANTVTGATQYEYKLENTSLGYSQTFVKGNSNFNLTQFTGLVNATTYSVSIRIYTGGSWGSYGPSCTVTTPANTPTTTLQPASCGMTASTYTQVIFANAFAGATQYEYRLENAGLGYSQSFAKSNNNFNLAQFTGLGNSTAYTVQVRLFFNGVWGAYGPACTVTTPASAIMLNSGNGEVASSAAQRLGVDNDEHQETGSFDVLAYPNPFNGVCSLNLLSYQVNENVVIRVYDATGKLVETHNLLPGDVKNLEIGADYAKGLYNVIVSQGTQSKSIKIIRQ